MTIVHLSIYAGVALLLWFLASGWNDFLESLGVTTQRQRDQERRRQIAQSALDGFLVGLNTADYPTYLQRYHSHDQFSRGSGVGGLHYRFPICLVSIWNGTAMRPEPMSEAEFGEWKQTGNTPTRIEP